MKTRRLTLLVAVGAALLLVLAIGAATAFAEGGILGASPDTTLSSTDTTVLTTDPTVPTTDTTVLTTDPTVPSTDTTVLTTDPTITTTDPTITTTDPTVPGTPPSSTTTTNWGQYISGLRHAGDHTPAAVLKGKKVPGWYKHHPTTTTTGSTP